MLLSGLMDFFKRLDDIVASKGTALCVGLDPRLSSTETAPHKKLMELNRRLIEATAEFAACFKPNLAFYEAFGPEGIEALEESLALIPKDIPVILDAKRGDIDATAEAYAQALFGRLKADCVTISPYMGRDSAKPFLDWEDKGLFLLCRTSNPGAGAFQDLLVDSPQAGGGREPLYVRVARECLSWSPRIGLVVAGNDLVALRAVRAAAPGAWFLAPGIGAQGGEPGPAMEAGCREDGRGILVNAARSVADAADPARAARELRDRMEEARKAALQKDRRPQAQGFGPGPADSTKSAPTKGDRSAELKRSLISALVATSCLKFGDFVLKSGKHSPFYIDLRRLVADPRAMALAGQAYASLAEGLGFVSLAGIPAAGLPLATAASLATGKPMIWPRMPVKEHGTGNRVEGDWRPGQRVLLLDDLITTGASKLEAAQILRGEGLVIEDLVVLIERGREGRKDMDKAGIRLHAFLHVRELFSACEALGLVDGRLRAELEAFVDAE